MGFLGGAMVKQRKPILMALALFLCAGVSAYAGSVDFTFDTQTINGTTITGLSSGATVAQIQTYMNAVLTASGCTGCSVTVLSNSSGSGAVADQTYTADGNVTGPGTALGPASKSLTLGDSNGATASTTTSTVNSSYDTFISNTSDSGGQYNGSNTSGTVTSQITLQFKNISGLTVNSFDYEVFPDLTCTQLNPANCGGAGDPNQPDLKFEAGNNTNGTDGLVQTFDGVTPGTTNGNAVKSTISSTELAPQAIGTWTGSLTGDTELDFVDWPATIGIDNLTIGGSNITAGSSVPEPASIALLGTLVFLLAKKLRRP
jgi:Flp pilus assembly protein TadG